MRTDKKPTRKHERGVSLAGIAPFFEASLDGIVLVDKERRYVYVNPAAETLLGDTADNLLGRDFIEATFPERMHGAMIAHFTSTLQGTPGLWETTIVRPDGTEREVQFSNLEFELDGENIIAAIIRDLTDERWRTREAAAAARVASSFTVDRPIDDALADLCKIIMEYSSALACSAMLPMRNGPLTTVGDAGHVPGYQQAMAEAWESGPPEFTKSFMRSMAPAMIENARTRLLGEPQYAVAHDVLEASRWEHMLVVPMIYAGRAVGGLTVCYAEHAKPSAREVQLIAAIAAQSAVAVENTRLLARAAERTEQLTAMMNASAAVASTVDVDTVIGSVLDQVGAIVDYSATSMLLLEGEELILVDSRVGRDTPRYDEQPRFPAAQDSGLWSAFVRGEVVRIADVDGETQYARELRRALGGRPGFRHLRSWLAIPLRAHGRLLGALTVSRNTPAFFTEEHERLLLGLANHAANGIERARLFEERERAAAETAALVRIASAMTFDQSPEEVLNLLAENVVTATGAVSCAVILIDPSGARVELAGTHNLEDGYVRAIESIWQSGADAPSIVAFRTSEVQIVHDIANQMLKHDIFESFHDFVRTFPWNMLVALPLVYHGRAQGVMNVYYSDSDRVVGDRELSYLNALADQASVVGANLRLFAEGERRRRRAEALARVASAMTFEESPKAVLDLLAENVLAVTGASSAGIIIVDNEANSITEVGAANLPEGYMATIEAMWKQGAQITGFEAARTGQVVVARDLPNLSKDLSYLDPYREFTDSHWDTLVAVPLTYRGESMGTLNVCYPKETPPDDEHMAVLRALADQAAITAANLRLFTESERRRRRAETLVQVALALTGRASIENTLEELSRVVVANTSAVAASVTLHDDLRGSFSYAGGHGMPEGFEQVAREAWSHGHHTLMTRALETLQPRVTKRGKTRILEDPDYADAWGLVRDEPWEPIAIIPMVHRGRPVGLLATYHLPGEAPAEDDIALLLAVAGQAAVAVENRRLFSETERRLRQVEAASTIASNIAFNQPLDEMMMTIALSVVESTGAIACSVTRVDESARTPLRIMAMAGLPDGYQEALQHAYDEGAPSVIVNAYREREAMIIHNSRGVTLADPRFADAAALVEREPWNCVAVIPIIYREEALAVLVGYYPAREEPTTEEVTYLTAIADQAAIAIKNASLIEDAQASAAVAERQRLARELHDSVSQALYGIALGARTARTLLDRDPVKAIEPVEYVLQLAQAGLAEMRALIFQLRPESLAQEGLVAALEKEVSATSARYGLIVEADLGEEPLVPLDIKEAAYRIGQEAMHNTVKHAKAERVWVTLGFEDGTLRLDVRDDGKGFDPTGEFPGHLGLKSMRERAARVHGTLDFESAPGQGVHISLGIPVSPGAEAHMPVSMRPVE